MLFLLISAVIMWVVSIVFMFRARADVAAKRRSGLIMSIRMSRLVFIASMGCILTALNLKTGYSIAFFLICGLAIVMGFKFVMDILHPESIADQMMNKDKMPDLRP